MKCAVQLLKFACIVLFFECFLFSCKKNNTTPGDTDDPQVENPGDSTNADTISNHLLLSNATKITGALPKGPGGSSLKISFKDTLYLADKVKRPIKFLHEDTTENVAGVYLQVHYGSIGGTFYYKVPELPDMADNDTVSVIMIGVDPEGFDNPVSFDLTIIPYIEGGEPIAEAIRPAIIDDPVIDPEGKNGACGLVLPPGDYWDWESSYISDGNGDFIFYNDRFKIWGGFGQDIKGSCCNGNSVYGFCLGDTAANASLHFYTFFTYIEEVFKFFDNGTFARFTSQFAANPDPQASDFCGTGPGVVKEGLSNIYYEGNWTIAPLTVPVDGDSLYLQLQGTSSTGGGYGNPGGRIRILDCYLMVLIQPDNEVPGRDLVKFYNNRRVNSPYWFPFI